MNQKFFVVDSQQLWVDETIKVLHSRYPQTEIFAATNASDFLNQVSIYKPDLVVMDISLAEKHGSGATDHRRPWTTGGWVG